MYLIFFVTHSMDFVCPINLTLIGISNPSPAPRFTHFPDSVAEAADPGKERNWKSTLFLWRPLSPTTRRKDLLMATATNHIHIYIYKEVTFWSEWSFCSIWSIYILFLLLFIFWYFIFNPTSTLSTYTIQYNSVSTLYSRHGPHKSTTVVPLWGPCNGREY